MIERGELSEPARGLRMYLLRVAERVEALAWYCEVGVPAYAYAALDGGIPRHPGREAALVWNENDGWAAGIETASGDDLIVLSYLGEDVLPEPETVAAFIGELRADGYPGRPDPPAFRLAGDDDGFEERLALHAGALPAP